MMMLVLLLGFVQGAMATHGAGVECDEGTSLVQALHTNSDAVALSIDSSSTHSLFQDLRQPCQSVPSAEQQLQGQVLDELCKRLGSARFLVFGTGFDSPFWMASNSLGVTVFLENNLAWIDTQPQQVKNAVREVNYTCVRHEAIAKINDEAMLSEFFDQQLPDDVKSTAWDQILVDSPEGHADDNPGRGQSIYAAFKLAKPSTTIFVDDCGREVEEKYISEYLVRNGRVMTQIDNGHSGKTCLISPEGEQ